MTDNQEEPTIRSYDRHGNARDEVLRTKTGKVITEADIEEWAAEAEEGYEFHDFEPILAGETRRADEEPKCQRCGKRKSLHKTVTERPSRPLFGPWL